MAETLRKNLAEIVQIELMIAKAQVCRNNMLREIELHRAMLAPTLRRTVQQIEDAEYQTVKKSVERASCKTFGRGVLETLYEVNRTRHI
jgi:hypothetical protein